VLFALDVCIFVLGRIFVRMLEPENMFIFGNIYYIYFFHKILL